jgi:transposase
MSIPVVGAITATSFATAIEDPDNFKKSRSVGASLGLRQWGLKLRERVGFKRAAVAVARKLAVVMHTVLRTGEFFERSARTAV